MLQPSVVTCKRLRLCPQRKWSKVRKSHEDTRRRRAYEFRGRERERRRQGRQGRRLTRAGATQEDDLILEPDSKVLFVACVTGLSTGAGVVTLNTLIHVVEHLTRGTSFRSAEWISSLPSFTFQSTAEESLFVPILGGSLVALLSLYSRKEGEISKGKAMQVSISPRQEVEGKGLQPLLDALSAAITLGTGSSLGPEGPSVDIGKNLAQSLRDTIPRRYLTALIAAGSAAGISAGFNAPISGVFFALETVLEKSDSAGGEGKKSSQGASSLSNSDSALNLAVVTLAAVIAAIVSQIGLGSEPAFEIPDYSLGSYLDWPLYLILGFLSGGVSLAFTKVVSYADRKIKGTEGVIPKESLPILGGVAMGCVALLVPEVTYEGFENFNKILRGGEAYTIPILGLICLAKIVTTSICKASGLVGGLYAPTLFLGAATGSLYGKLICNIFGGTQLESMVGGQQSFALVGMASVLSAACRVPLTSTLLLFELTRDYGIVLPTLGGVALSFLFVSSDNLFARPSQAAETTEWKTETENTQVLSSDTTARLIPREYIISQCLGIEADVEPSALSALLDNYECPFFIQLNRGNTAPERIISTRAAREALASWSERDTNSDNGVIFMNKESLNGILSDIGTTEFTVVDKDVPLGSFFDQDELLSAEMGKKKVRTALEEGEEGETLLVVVDKNSIPVGIMQKSFD